eukprot:TRINITY_DN7481_c0_g1_i1.p1 TRINITY_DN7481_c0_g1~~TRINITY_DN7481_c0_g1_i1.p1  ORF type:complete len:364 (-),score=83.14 TRINITY_DN7481_c0_g1_i1:313-1404(-)
MMQVDRLRLGAFSARPHIGTSRDMAAPPPPTAAGSKAFQGQATLRVQSPSAAPPLACKGCSKSGRPAAHRLYVMPATTSTAALSPATSSLGSRARGAASLVVATVYTPHLSATTDDEQLDVTREAPAAAACPSPACLPPTPPRGDGGAFPKFPPAIATQEANAENEEGMEAVQLNDGAGSALQPLTQDAISMSSDGPAAAEDDKEDDKSTTVGTSASSEAESSRERSTSGGTLASSNSPPRASLPSKDTIREAIEVFTTYCSLQLEDKEMPTLEEMSDEMKEMLMRVSGLVASDTGVPPQQVAQQMWGRISSRLSTKSTAATAAAPSAESRQDPGSPKRTEGVLGSRLHASLRAALLLGMTPR